MPTQLNKRKMIREHVTGKTFVDVGGLWGTKGEMVTTAAAGGASALTMADVQPLGNMWWQKFEAWCAEKEVTGCQELNVDICDPQSTATIGTYDMVHCAGVMYHVADLFQFVSNLVSVTREYLVLSSVVMPDEMQTSAGNLTFGPDHAYLSPVLAGDNKAVVLQYLADHNLTAGGLNQDAPYFADGKPRTGPWWWLFSGSFMANVVRLHDMEVMAEGATPNGLGYTVFARLNNPKN